MTTMYASIRRITFPALICMRAWLYDHGLASSKFSNHTHRVFVYFDRSYRTLYSAVQSAFDHYAAEVLNA